MFLSSLVLFVLLLFRLRCTEITKTNLGFGGIATTNQTLVLCFRPRYQGSLNVAWFLLSWLWVAFLSGSNQNQSKASLFWVFQPTYQTPLGECKRCKKRTWAKIFSSQDWCFVCFWCRGSSPEKKLSWEIEDFDSARLFAVCSTVFFVFRIRLRTQFLRCWSQLENPKSSFVFFRIKYQQNTRL